MIRLYWLLWWRVDGTSEYGQAIRWCYLLGQLGKDPKASKRMEKLDSRNFIKWRKLHNKNFSAYLEVSRV